MWEDRLLDIELELISPTLDFQLPDEIPLPLSEMLEQACSGSYRGCLTICCKNLPFLNHLTIDDVGLLKSSVHQFITKSNESDKKEERAERELQVLLFGASCLQLFVIYNWTGPPTSDLDSVFPNLDLKEIEEDLMQLLEVDGEHVYSLADGSILLYMAMVVLSQPDVFQHCTTGPWWCLRYLSIHQQLLPERSPSLHTLSKNTIQHLTSATFTDFLKLRSHKIQLYLETGLLQLYYYQYKDAESSFETARSISGISCSFGGALGVRTRFQTKALAQLKIQISRMERETLNTKTPELSADDIPKALLLNDDTLLENVKFTDDGENDDVVLTAEEHALVLMMCTNMQRTSPSHKLQDEQLNCIIEYLLSNPKSWCVHTEALRVRSSLERHRFRTVERSMMQLEALVKNITLKPSAAAGDPHRTAVQRLSLFYCVWPKPNWKLQAGFF